MYQRDEVEITVPADTDNRPDITQYSITCPPLEKIEMTSRLIRTLRLERTIVFCNTKVMCQRLRDDLVRMGLDADCIHGDIPQQKREKTMRTFKEGKLPILIATDVASRGIDVDDVDCVINYDVPRRTSIISTASAARAVPGKRASPCPSSARSRSRRSWRRSRNIPTTPYSP